MRGELTKLTKFLEVYGKPDTAFDVIRPNDKQSLVATFDKLEMRLEQRLCNTSSEEALAIFIRQTQLGFTGQADACYTFSVEHDKRGTQMADFFSELHGRFVNVLQWLHLNYADYFDHSLPVPIGLRRELAQVEGTPESLDRLKGSNADSRLIGLLNRLLSDEHSDDPEGATWAYFDYRAKLISRLNSTISNHEDGIDATVPIIECLVSCNVNTDGFYSYLESYIDRITEGNATFEEKEEELEILLRKMERVRINPTMAYHAKTGHVRDFITGCIMLELDRIKRSKKSTNQWGNAKNNGRESFYFAIAATIQVLLLVAWLMIEVGFIKSKNHSRLYLFVRNHIRTERTQSPSPRYMRNNFGPNKASPKTIRNTRALLMRMVDRLDRLAAERKVK